MNKLEKLGLLMLVWTMAGLISPEKPDTLIIFGLLLGSTVFFLGDGA